MDLEGIDHVAMGVRDIERSAKWYIDVLGFERRYDSANVRLTTAVTSLRTVLVS